MSHGCQSTADHGRRDSITQSPQIYGLERSDGRSAIVMELVEGTTRRAHRAGPAAAERSAASRGGDSDSASIVVVQNWLEELKRRVPAN